MENWKYHKYHKYHKYKMSIKLSGGEVIGYAKISKSSKEEKGV